MFSIDEAKRTLSDTNKQFSNLLDKVELATVGNNYKNELSQLLSKYKQIDVILSKFDSSSHSFNNNDKSSSNDLTIETKISNIGTTAFNEILNQIENETKTDTNSSNNNNDFENFNLSLNLSSDTSNMMKFIHEQLPSNTKEFINKPVC